MDGFPDNFQINFEVTMSNAITHCIYDRPGYFRVSTGKLGVVNFYVVSGFAYDFKIADYGILSFAILKESDFTYILNIFMDSFDGLNYMAKIIPYAKNIGLDRKSVV